MAEYVGVLKVRKPLFKRTQFRWILVHQNGNTVATSGESYANKSECLAQFGKIFGDRYIITDETLY